jgi:signal transduction histidine kinase
MRSSSPRFRQSSARHPSAPEGDTSASDSGPSTWVFHLSPTGIIQAYHFGHEGQIEPIHDPGSSPTASPQPGQTIAQDKHPWDQPQWIGQSFGAIIQWAEDSLGFEQSLSTMEATLVPVQLTGLLTTADLSWDCLWLLHPLQLPDGGVFQIIAVGYPQPVEIAPTPVPLNLAPEPSDSALHSPGVLVSSANSCTQIQVYAPRLAQITRNIRWTLDLETIRQRTVEGLGELFGVQRCLICSYDNQPQVVTVAAEFRRDLTMPSWLNREHGLSQTHYLSQAAASALATCSRLNDGSNLAVLSVATRYQNQINGFILLYDSQSRNWSDVELGLITDLADQVGTAITHARLFGESQALAIKLQQANASLIDKQREFQEAQRQAEEARQQAEEASRLKSEFLANTSHELRTPLNGMIGFLKLVLDGMADDPDEQQEFIEEAHKSALHLLNLINDVLDIAKIEAGKMQIDMGPVNLKELLADLENFARPQAEHKSLYFNILIPSTRDEITLNGNYQRLLQVLLNLVGNAIKFTHEGGITISAEVKPQRAEYQGKTWPGTVRISVADTGIGVSLEKQDRLFQTFSQVDGERTRQYGGTGLGLAISQKLVEAMGGVVQFISMGEGLGSTVTFTVLLYQEPVIIDKEPVYPSKS